MHKEKSINEEDFHLIEAYLDGELDDLKASEITRRLYEDTDFKDAFEEIKAMRIDLETAFMKKKLSEFHQDIEIESINSEIQPNKKKLSFYILPVAAVLIISLGLFWLLKPNSNKQIFNQYYSPDPGLPTVMGEQSNFEFFDGMVNYKREEYSQALSKWIELLKENPQNDTLNYFIGMAYMASDKDANAVTFIDNVINNQESEFWEDAQYYKALYLLKIEDTDAAIDLLNGLTENPDAQALLKEIKKND